MFRSMFLSSYCGELMSPLNVYLLFFRSDFYEQLSSAFKVRCSSTVGLRTIGTHMCAGGSPNVHLLFLPPWLQWGSNPQPPDYQAALPVHRVS